MAMAIKNEKNQSALNVKTNFMFYILFLLFFIIFMMKIKTFFSFNTLICNAVGVVIVVDDGFFFFCSSLLSVKGWKVVENLCHKWG